MQTFNDIQKMLLDPNWNNADPSSSVRIGVGFNSFQNNVMAQALVSIPTSNQTLSSSSSFVSIESITQLRRSLGLSIDAGISSVFFSVQDNFDYTDTSDYNSYDFFALATMQVRLRSDIMNGGDLLYPDDAENLTQVEFWKKYGDSWVNRIDYGGTLYGLLHVQCQTADQKTTLRNQLSASGSGASLSANITNMYESMSKIGQVSTLFMTTGVQPQLVDQNTFQAAIESFSGQVLETGGVPLGFGLTSYDTANWPPAGNPQAEFTDAHNWLGREMATAEQCQGLLDNIAYIMSNQSSFDLSTVSVATLQNETNTLDVIVDSIATEIQTLIDDPISAKSPTIFDISGIVLPRMRAIPPPNIATWVGAFGIGVVNGDSNNWAGIPGTPSDSFGVYNPPADQLDLHFSYTGKFVSVQMGLFPNPSVYTESSGDGGKAGAVGPRLAYRHLHNFRRQ